MKDYFSIEQLDRRILSAKAEIQQIRRKILTLTIIASAFLVYSWRFIFDFKMFTTLFVIPLTLNGLTWLLVIAISVLRFMRLRVQFEDKWSQFDQEGVIDEYRAYQYYLRKLNGYEAIFDILIGLQFLFLVVCFFMTYFLRW